MKPIQVYLTQEQHKQLKQEALDTGLGISDIVRQRVFKEAAFVPPKGTSLTGAAVETLIPKARQSGISPATAEKFLDSIEKKDKTYTELRAEKMEALKPVAKEMAEEIKKIRSTKLCKTHGVDPSVCKMMKH